jgi:hypothetical protein
VHTDVLVDEVALDQAAVLLVDFWGGWEKDVRLEGVDVVAVLQKVGNDLVCGAHRRLAHKIAAQAARVVAEAIGRGVLFDIRPFGVDGSEVRRPAVHCQLASQIESKDTGLLFHRATLDATSATAGLELDVASGDVAHTGVVPSWNVLAISTDASIASVEKRGLREVVRPPRPVVVWEVAFVAALVAQKLFVRPGVVTVPCEEVRLVSIRCHGAYKRITASLQSHGPSMSGSRA